LVEPIISLTTKNMGKTFKVRKLERASRVKVSGEAHRRLKMLAAKEMKPMTECLTELLSRYERQLFLGRMNQGKMLAKKAKSVS